MVDKLASTCAYHTGLESDIKHICNKLDEREKQMNIKFDGIARELITAKLEMDRRLEQMNEFRAQLTSQAATFVSRGEMKLILDKVESRLEVLQNMAALKAGGKQWADYIITVLVSSAVFILLRLVLKI